MGGFYEWAGWIALGLLALVFLVLAVLVLIAVAREIIEHRGLPPT